MSENRSSNPIPETCSKCGGPRGRTNGTCTFIDCPDPLGDSIDEGRIKAPRGYRRPSEVQAEAVEGWRCPFDECGKPREEHTVVGRNPIELRCPEQRPNEAPNDFVVGDRVVTGLAGIGSEHGSIVGFRTQEVADILLLNGNRAHLHVKSLRRLSDPRTQEAPVTDWRASYQRAQDRITELEAQLASTQRTDMCRECTSDDDHGYGCSRVVKEARIARDRELKAQLAESAAKDSIRAAIATIDDMTLDYFERETRARAVLTAALTGGQKV